LWFDAINSIWKKTYPIGGRVRLEKDDLIKSARKLSGHHDLGKDFRDEPLERLLKSIREEAQLHPIGEFISRKRFINLLSVRLRAEYWFKKHPEILEQELYPVTVITGLQRTGTTKLHRLLAADPDMRTLSSWEALNPAPLNGDIHTGKDRVKIAHTSEKVLKMMAPGFFAIHPVEHLAPEEDVLLLDVSFLSTTPEATMHVPSYASWLENTDQTLAYSYAAKLMKFLQWQNPARHWILKSPHHLEFLDLADKCFGKLNFIWTHRNVNESVPSFMSMMSHSRILFSNHLDKNEVARHWVRKNTYMLEKAMNFRNSNNNKNRFTDVFYDELVKDSLSVLGRIYTANGYKINAELQKNFIKTESDNPKRKYGIHQYKLEDFGIAQDELNSHMAQYQQLQHSIFTRK